MNEKTAPAKGINSYFQLKCNHMLHVPQIMENKGHQKLYTIDVRVAIICL